MNIKPPGTFFPQPTFLHVFALLAICTFVQVTSKGVSTMNMVIKERAGLFEAVLAFILMAKNYQNKGYFSSSLTWINIRTLYGRFHDYIARVRMFNQDPSKGQVVVAKKYGLVVGTVSFSFNPDVTPCDKIFPDEMNSLRQSGQSFVYLGSFAVSTSYVCTRLSLRMLRAVWNTAKLRGVDLGVCVVHPHHSAFYKRFGFTEIASSTIPELDHAPAALLVVKRHAVRL